MINLAQNTKTVQLKFSSEATANHAEILRNDTKELKCIQSSAVQYNQNNFIDWEFAPVHCTKSQEKIFKVIAQYTNPETGIIYLTDIGIAKISGCSVRTIERAKEAYKQRGIYEQDRQRCEKGRWLPVCKRLKRPTSSTRHFLSYNLERKKEKKESINTCFASLGVKEEKIEKPEPIETQITISKPQTKRKLDSNRRPNPQTLKNIKNLGLTNDQIESEHNSWVIYTLKQDPGRLLSDIEVNAMFYHYCKTTVEKRQLYKAQKKHFFSAEARRNWHQDTSPDKPRRVDKPLESYKPVSQKEYIADKHARDKMMAKACAGYYDPATYVNHRNK